MDYTECFVKKREASKIFFFNLKKGFKSSRRKETMWSSLPINEHIRLHPHVEQSLLKTTLKLAEGLLYYEDCKKDTQIIM